jgi:hypothetical protein
MKYGLYLLGFYLRKKQSNDAIENSGKFLIFKYLVIKYLENGLVFNVMGL